MHSFGKKLLAFSKGKSSRKFARSGSATTKSLVTVLALVMFLLYVTSVGVSASKSSGSAVTAATLTHTTTVYRTKTVTKTVYDHETTTVTATSTVTDTSTSVSTSTSTVTDTTTSAVCCQTTTTTVTQPAVTTTITSTTTVTKTPNVIGNSATIDMPAADASDEYTIFNQLPADCSVTLSLQTENFAYNSAYSPSLQLFVYNGQGNFVGESTLTTSADLNAYSTQVSAGEIRLVITDSGGPMASDLYIKYSVTGICP